MSCFIQFKYLANNVNRNFVTDFFSSFLQCLIGQVLENKIWLQFVYTKTLIIIHCKPEAGENVQIIKPFCVTEIEITILFRY